jgi:hypothetical protein
MNVIVLTPDRVGSTLLQRLLTVYMAAHNFDKPVINIHDITNGLEIYYSDVFNQEVLGKPQFASKNFPKKKWGYYQSLDTVVDLLEQVDHYKTARLIHYHIKQRQDSLADQLHLYDYLNKNFFIISARRSNIFEYAISWAITLATKSFNVTTHDKKLDAYHKIYKNGINIDPKIIEKYLTDYKNYLKWCDDHFQVNSYFDYDKDLKNIENYILNLDIFADKNKRTWNDIFSMEWEDWNKCHKLISDMGSSDTKLLENFGTTPSRNQSSLDLLRTNLSLENQKYLIDHGKNYTTVYNGIEELIGQGVLPTGIPIKLQTLAEKRKIIKNFDQCVEAYNQWVEKNEFGEKYTDSDLKFLANEEVKRWYPDVPKNLLLE